MKLLKNIALLLMLASLPSCASHSNLANSQVAGKPTTSSLGPRRVEFVAPPDFTLKELRGNADQIVALEFSTPKGPGSMLLSRANMVQAKKIDAEAVKPFMDGILKASGKVLQQGPADVAGSTGNGYQVEFLYTPRDTQLHSQFLFFSDQGVNYCFLLNTSPDDWDKHREMFDKTVKSFRFL